MRVSAIVVAAGSGVRLGATLPKAYVRLAGETLLCRSLSNLLRVAAISEVVIAVPGGTETRARNEVTAARVTVPAKILAGGRERQESVAIALALTSPAADLIAVQDAARPFASGELLARCIGAADRTGAAIVAVPLADTLKRVDGFSIRETIPRAGLWQAQTPQVFRRELLIRAHREAERLGVNATDDADLVERLGTPVSIVEGSAVNLKITTPEDLRIAEAIAHSLKSST